MPMDDQPSPVRPVAAPSGHGAGAGYAAAARFLSAMPPVAGSEAPPRPDAQPGLDAAALLAARMVLPGGAGGLALPLALAALRVDVPRWLGEDALRVLAERLGLRERVLAVLFDTPPLPPAGLGEPARWTGRQVPLLTARGALCWLDLFWRREAGRTAGCENFALAARLSVPGAGRVDLRARLENSRIDVVMETSESMPRAFSADLSDTFAAMLPKLRLQGSLTLRHQKQAHDT
ncbi:hypothetical protein ACFOD4_13870 [Pseudoroseomonas globiformis]|uniref:Ubiquinone biosynthesis accessory factor UbiT n=1 Tax=Teichococcus globiformis TaxID=2307229 RepID=A0ABV7G3A2_9PROT